MRRSDFPSTRHVADEHTSAQAIGVDRNTRNAIKQYTDKHDLSLASALERLVFIAINRVDALERYRDK